jgi:RNA polymerase sigma factor (TIGR02999 family)
VKKEPDLTGLLQAWSDGDADALAILAALVNDELRGMARRIAAGEHRKDWRPTELVQEAYLRLLDWRGVHWENRAHFFATAAGMMRRVLVDAARARRAFKRGEGLDPVTLDEMEIAGSDPNVDLIAVEEALQALAGVNPRAARVVEFRFFGGFSVEETAEALDVSVRTVINDWNTARAWLYRKLSSDR